MAASFADEDLDAAVAQGALSAEAAASLRAFVENRRALPAADEEMFRLLTGFNDIFVTIAIAMVLAATAWLGGQLSPGLGGALVAAASWPLAEFFTRQRRMALPSLALLIAFVGGVGWTVLGFAPPSLISNVHGGAPLAAGAAAVIAAFAHWRRFHVPITVAAGALAASAALIGALNAWAPGNQLTWPAMALLGFLIFALALRWDASDPLRQTRRADVAFWLHLTAAPMIVHPAFTLLGFSVGDSAQPVLALAIYLALALVALIVDRRALMVSALIYLLYAMSTLLHATGAMTSSFALSALIAGAGLLLLSAYWGAARRLAVAALPERWKALLPRASA